MFESKIPININQGGFATLDEIEKVTYRMDYQDGNVAIAGMNVTSDGKQSLVYADDSFWNIIGSTGSKKTRIAVTSYIYNHAFAGNSMVIMDVKGDIYRLLSSYLKEQGYKIIVLDFNEPSRGDAYNLISPIYRDYKCGNIGKANRELINLAEIIFESVKSEKDPFWHTSSMFYFVGCMLTLFELFDEKYATIANALNLHIQGDKKMVGGTSYLKAYYSDKENSEAWKALVTTVNAPNETRNSIHSVYTSALNKLIGQNKELMNMMSHSTFEVSDFVDEKTAVFMIANEESLSVVGGLISAIIQQWYAALVKIAEQSSNGVLKRNIVFVLDEFGNLPAINEFQMKISLSRARGISWMLVLQSFAQLELRYGKDVARTIIGNTANWVYLFSPDPELLAYISNLCGDVTDEYTGHTRKLLSVNQLRHLKKCDEDGKTECLMYLGRLKPFITRLPDISQYYGIEPIDEINLPKRNDGEMPELDFISAVDNKRKEDLHKRLEEAQKEKKARQEAAEKNKKESSVDKYNLKGIMNDVISDLSGGNE